MPHSEASFNGWSFIFVGEYWEYWERERKENLKNFSSLMQISPYFWKRVNLFFFFSFLEPKSEWKLCDKFSFFYAGFYHLHPWMLLLLVGINLFSPPTFCYPYIETQAMLGGGMESLIRGENLHTLPHRAGHNVLHSFSLHISVLKRCSFHCPTL